MKKDPIKLTVEQQALVESKIRLAKSMASKFCKRYNCKRLYDEISSTCLLFLCHCATKYRIVTDASGNTVPFGAFFAKVAWCEMTREMRHCLSRGMTGLEWQLRRHKLTYDQLVRVEAEEHGLNDAEANGHFVGWELETVERAEVVGERINAIVPPEYREAILLVVRDGESVLGAARTMPGGESSREAHRLSCHLDGWLRRLRREAGRWQRV